MERIYVLLDHSKEEYPAIMQGTKEEMQVELDKLLAEEPDEIRYEIMPYDVYDAAFGFEMNERFF